MCNTLKHIIYLTLSNVNTLPITFEQTFGKQIPVILAKTTTYNQFDAYLCGLARSAELARINQKDKP